MQSAQEWIEENRPNSDPDYQRLSEVTRIIETEMAKEGEEEPYDRRFTYDTVLKYGARRTEEHMRATVPLENPSFEVMLPVLVRSWVEGFAFGALAYSQQGRGRKSEAFQDRIALADVKHGLHRRDAADELSEAFNDIVSPKTLEFVATVRSFRARQIFSSISPTADHQMVQDILASHWSDAFFVGVVFEELGGHRDKLNG